jgi:hypothetical protein
MQNNKTFAFTRGYFWAEDTVCPNFSQKKAVLQNYLTQLNISVSATDTKTVLHEKLKPKKTTCSSAFVHTSFVIFSKAAYVSSLTSFNRKVVFVFSHETFDLRPY